MTNKRERKNTEFAIEANQLSKKFGSLTAVDQLDLKVPKANIYGFLGPNGSGKSTTIRVLCGLLKPSSGSARVLGCQVPEQAEALRAQIGYMTQSFSLYKDLSVLENLRFMGQVFSIDKKPLKLRIDELIERYSLSNHAQQNAGSLSGGQKQRLALAVATLHKPALLFLDEPTSAVDPENRRDFWEKLYDLCDEGTTILVSTHYMDEAERCHRLAILDRGKLCADGSPQQLMHAMGVHVVEIKAENLRDLKTKVLRCKEVSSAAQQGIRLRVLVKKSIADPIAFLKQEFEMGEDSQLDLVHPSLEDVFVSVTSAGHKE